MSLPPIAVLREQFVRILRRILDIKSVAARMPHIPLIQFVGFRGFRDHTTLKCASITLVIGKNNTGKTSLLEVFRLCTAASLREFLLEFRERYGEVGLTSGIDYIFSASENYYHPPSTRVGFLSGISAHGVAIRREGHRLSLQWYRAQRLLCSFVTSDDLAKGRFFWGPATQRVDGRSLTQAFESDAISEDFEHLVSVTGCNLRMAYHRSSRDDRDLLDAFERRLTTQLSQERRSRFLTETASFFGMPPLLTMGIAKVNYVITPEPRYLRETAVMFQELAALREIVRAFVARSRKKKELRKVLKVVSDLADSVDPNRPRVETPGAGGLVFERDFSSAKKLGSGFRSLLSLCLDIELNDLILIDEPEAFLHAGLQLKLASFIRTQAKVGKQFVIASHSEVFLNSLFGVPECSVIETAVNDGRCVLRGIQGGRQVSSVLDELGVTASHLLQANAVIWVEGPSDRIYVKRWIECWTHGRLQEGIHYQCVTYGGRLLAHYAASDNAHASEKIAMLRINRHAVVMMDSDLEAEDDVINTTKLRVIRETRECDGFAWVTHGRTIENYMSRQIASILGLPNFERYDSIDDALRRYAEQHRPSIAKVDLALRVTRSLQRSDIESNPELAEVLSAMCARILLWNHMS